MSGQRETPGSRRDRDQAATGDDDQPATTEVVVASAGTATEVVRANRYGRRHDATRAPAMVASAARININDRRAIRSTRTRRQGWQSEAWDYFDEIGEIGYTTTYIANLMSKLRLYPAVHTDDGPVSVHLIHEDSEQTENARDALTETGVTPDVADTAIDTLRRLRSQQGGQSAILRELSLNLEVAGECYIHGHQEWEGAPDPGDDYDYDDPDGGYDPTLVEDWNIRSVDELIINNDQFEIRRGPGVKQGNPIPPGDLVIRVWERHPRFSEIATCAMRRVLAEAEALLLLSREVRATSKSRLSNGILLIPAELSFGSVDPTRDPADGEETDDPFDDELQEAMITPIQEEGSASAVVPLVLRGPADLLQHVNHLALDKTLDPVLDARIEQRILRIARGLNMPTEVTTGLMATTFANAVQVKRSEFEDHIEPRAVLVCDAITSGYFQWALEQAGVPVDVAREIFVWFDASALIQVEDMSEQATKAHEDGIISDSARRRYTGFAEEDAPDDAEILRRLLLRGGRMDPFIEANLFRLTGLVEHMPVPAPPAGVLGHVESVSAMPAPGAATSTVIDPTTGQAVATPPAAAPAAPEGTGATAPVTSSGAPTGDDRWKKLGRQLTGIDRELRGRITGKLDQAMRIALERAGNRIKAKVQRDKGGDYSALRHIADGVPAGQVAAALGRGGLVAAGISDSELIDGAYDQALTDIGTWMDVAYERAVRAVERTAGPVAQPRRVEMDAAHHRNVTAAGDWLRANLHALTAERLYTPTPAVPPAGEHDGTVLIPANLVRAAVAVAGGASPKGGTAVADTATASAWLEMGGGGPVTDQAGKPLGGIGTGPDMMTTVGQAGASVEGWQWEYGEGMRSEFEPHLELDGTIVARTDDPAWANRTDFPATDFYFPGDHDGCVCDIIPVILGPQGIATESISDFDTMQESAGPAADEAAAGETADETQPGTDEQGYSTLQPDALADSLGYARGYGDPSQEDVDAATATLRDTRRAIQTAAQQVAEDHMSLLRQAQYGERGTLKYIYNPAERAKRGDVGTGAYDWFDSLDPDEKGRLRAWMENRNAQSGNASDYSEASEALARVFNMEGANEQDVMERYLQETRIIDAAQALANNRAINPKRYGGLDINDLLDTPYDLRRLFGSNREAVEELARVNAGQTADDALMMLGEAAGRGPKLGAAPWEMSEAEYVAETERLETAARAVVPEREDEWDGPVYSRDDQATLERLRELVPPGVDDPDQPMSYADLYRTILQIARTGGLI